MKYTPQGWQSGTSKGCWTLSPPHRPWGRLSRIRNAWSLAQAPLTRRWVYTSRGLGQCHRLRQREKRLQASLTQRILPRGRCSRQCPCRGGVICSQQDWTVRARWQPLTSLLLPLNPTRRGSSLLTRSEGSQGCWGHRVNEQQH